MISLLIIPILWIAIAAGRTIGSLAKTPQSATPLERILLSGGIGLGLLAYGVLGVGLIGVLNIVGICVVMALLTVLGANQHVLMAKELALCLSPPYKMSVVSVGVSILALMLAAVALIGCFTPPTLNIGSTDRKSVV